MSISKWLDQSASLPEKNFDVVIVGAGIAGLSAAYWLQKRDPGLKIAVIEKHRVGFGASGRNAGFVTCGSTEHFIKLEKDFGLARALEIWKFSEENHRLLLEEIIQEQGDSIGYRRTGSCTVAPSEERWQTYQSVAATMRSVGIDVHEVSPAAMEAQYGVTGFAGGIQYAGDGFVDPVRLLGLMRAKLRVDFFEGAEVFAIEDGLSGAGAGASAGAVVRTDRGVFRAGKVILTLNAYLPLVLPQFKSLVVPGRGQILMTEPLPPFVQGPCYLTKHLAYFRQLPTGELIVGGFRNLARDIEATYADETTALIQNALFDFLRSHFKFGAGARIAYQWSGTMGFTPDGQMILGAADSLRNVHVMAGCSGHGLGLSFHAAQRLVGSLYGEPLPAWTNLQRFAGK